jgi:hypothetical protein
MHDLRRWRVRDSKIFFDDRLFGREEENLPTVFAMEARADLELGQVRAREKALIEASEILDLDIPDLKE